MTQFVALKSIRNRSLSEDKVNFATSSGVASRKIARRIALYWRLRSSDIPMDLMGGSLQSDDYFMFSDARATGKQNRDSIYDIYSPNFPKSYSQQNTQILG